MIDRQAVFKALFKLKDAGLDVSRPLDLMASSRGIPQEVIKFLRDNSPQFQFYRYIQKYQKALAKSILDYEELSVEDKIVALSSFITRAYLAVKYKNLDKSLLDDLSLGEITDALNRSISEYDDSGLDEALSRLKNSLKLFYSEEGNPGS